MLIHWIWLATRPGLTDRMKVGLLQHFSDPEDIFYTSGHGFDHIAELSPEGKEQLLDKSLAQAEEILDACAREKIHILTFRDTAYPSRLKNISDPPLILYYKGSLPDFDGSPMIGVVGTRKASLYGLTAAKRMGYQIARCGGIVVSGMAFGIDGVAMSGALTAGGQTVGVLGCGADMVYPVSNKALFADVEKFGCILSEFPPGTPPLRWNFPKRNRIISGLSNGVLVVEAPEKSGSLITANLALEQGRDVFVVPGNIDVPSFVGSNRLLRDGATLAGTGWDILSEYEAQYPDKIRKDDTKATLAGYSDEVARIASQAEKTHSKVAQKPLLPSKKPAKKKKCNQNVIDNDNSQSYSDNHKPQPKLSAEEQRIYDALLNGERLVDDVIAETGISAGKMLAMLTILELRGVVRRLPGKRIQLK